MQFMPRKSMNLELLHEGIRVKCCHVKDPRLPPLTSQKHQGADHGGHSRGIAHGLRACLLIGVLVSAIIIDVIGFLLMILTPSDAAADGGLTRIMLAEFSWIGQDRFEELKRYNLLALIENGFNAGHADILNDA